jgi:chorismate mutase
MGHKQLDLESLRQTIDQLDAGILNMLEKRMQTALKISEAKKKLGREVYDEKREKALFDLLKKTNSKSVLSDDQVIEIWEKIIEISRQLQSAKM